LTTYTALPCGAAHDSLRNVTFALRIYQFLPRDGDGMLAQHMLWTWTCLSVSHKPEFNQNG